MSAVWGSNNHLNPQFSGISFEICHVTDNTCTLLSQLEDQFGSINKVVSLTV